MAYLIILRKRVNGILSNKCQMEEYKINQIRWTCHLTAIKRTPLQKLTQLRTSLKQNRHLLKLGWKESILSLPKKWLSGTSPRQTVASSRTEDVSLPKLPLPSLETTLEKYEKHLSPLLDEDGRSRVRDIIKDFGNTLGPKLQLYLLEKQKRNDNWAYEYWLNEMYLGNQLALPVNSNPGMIFPPRKFTTILDVARFAAGILISVVKFKDVIDKRLLPRDRATSREKGQPLCMAQYYRILNACRIPGTKIDRQHIETEPINGNNNKDEYVIVICRNQFYYLKVKNKSISLSEDDICSNLLHILNEAPCLEGPPPVGILTTWKRPLWAEARNALSQDETNVNNLKLIENALLVLCLDEPLTDTFNSRMSRGVRGHTVGCRDETNLMLQMIHGGGSRFNSANRWFDKTIQIIISGDGACGLCYEHSFAEGGPIIATVQKWMEEVNSLPQNCDVPNCDDNLQLPIKLDWILDSHNHRHISDAITAIDSLASDLDFQVFRFDGYGKNFIKSCKVSPDSYIQLALQLAYYKLNGKLTATYESASLTRFLHGRVDCIRAASPEALQWVQAMAQPKDDDLCNKKVTFHLVSDERKFELWNEAIKQQTNEMIDNIMGEGIDLHLSGLREAAKDTSPTAAHPLPKIFTDESYRIFNKFLLSTSQVLTAGDSIMGYGPVEPNGYGCSYNPKDNHIAFCISAFWSSETTSSCKFAQCLEESLNAMQGLLSRVK